MCEKCRIEELELKQEGSLVTSKNRISVDKVHTEGKTIHLRK